jgi:glycogen debranching enzyme
LQWGETVLTQVIKEGDLFFYSDDNGDLPAGDDRGLGMFTQDTRFLSRLEWKLEGIPTVPLGGEADGATSCYRFTNREGTDAEGKPVGGDLLDITRKRWIYGGVVYETFSFINRGDRPVQTRLSLLVDADFADMFVVRGWKGRVGKREGVTPTEKGVRFSYRGVDGVHRTTDVETDGTPAEVADDGTIRFPLRLESNVCRSVHLRYVPGTDGEIPRVIGEQQSLLKLEESEREWFVGTPEVNSDWDDFNRMFARGLKDLRMLLTDLGDGPFPVAGLPIYAVPFGRDSLIAALQALPVRPEVAKGTLRILAKYQGKKEDAWRDEEPGKILHEIRFGELARSGQIPFTPYYGSIDSTPLFLILIAEVYRWTGDLDFVREMVPHAIEALNWIDRYGDPAGTGYVSYAMRSSKGIRNQGWKDSEDSVVHRDGRLAEAPIALSEVQGYVYMAKKAWSDLFRLLGDGERSERLNREAELLRERFARDFWMEDEQFVALALDGEGKQAGTVTSNPGHCLMTGILPPEQAERVARRLLEPDLFSGWGVRTKSSACKSYDPDSYHNGSVWPHDNALILLGLKRLGFYREAERIIRGLVEASVYFQHRLPELFSGHERGEGGPLPYPVACSPQAWAAGTAFTILQAILGVEPDPVGKRIHLHPDLPQGMNRLSVRRLRLGQGVLDLNLERVGDATRTWVEINTTGWDVAIHPC